MDLSTLCPWLLLLLLLVPLLLMLQKNNKANKPNFPPSPPKLPIIGNLHQLGEFPHRALCHLSKKYGPIMLLHLGRAPTLVVSSAEIARQVLKIHDHECCNRPLSVGSKRLSYNYLDVAFAPYGDYSREMKKIVILELLSMKRVHSFRFIRAEEVSLMINSICQSCSRPVNLTEKLYSLVDDILCRVAFGKVYRAREFDNGRFEDVLSEAMAMLGSFSATDFFPSVGWIIDYLYRLHARLNKSFHDLDGFYKQVIDEHLKPERPDPEQEDIIDVLLRIERDQLGAVRLTKQHIKAILMNIFLGGVDTSAVTIVWAMAELVKNPRVMKKVQDEVRNYVGRKGQVDDTDLDQLGYLKMVVKETLRLHPPTPLLIPREAISHFKINDYDIYPKTRIQVNVWAIGRDPESWKNPEEFFPERFMDRSLDFKGSNFEFLPFGAGRRICPGIPMAIASIELTLANLLCCFNWELPSGMKKEDIDMDESPGLVVRKKSTLRLVPIKASIISDH